MSDLEQFTQGYIGAMFWTEEEEIGLEKDFDNLSKEDQDTIENECIKFYQANHCTMLLCSEKFSQHGHDFWLTRNGHGAGFWDRGYRKRLANKLTKYSKECKPAYLLLNDETDGISYNSEWIL